MINNLPAPVQKAYRERMEALSVFPKRMVRPDEFAQTVAFIVDNHAINADLIRLDAGVRIS